MQRRPPLGDDGAQAAGTRCRRDLAEGLGRDVECRSAGAASVADQPAGDGDDEELLAVDERFDVKAALDGMDDASHALDEEGPARIPVRAIGLEASDLIERGPGIERDPIGVNFMRHSPFGEPGARYEEKAADDARDRSRAAAIRSAGPHPQDSVSARDVPRAMQYGPRASAAARLPLARLRTIQHRLDDAVDRDLRAQAGLVGKHVPTGEDHQ